MVYPAYKLPFEMLTTIDERVDYVHNQVLAAQISLNKLLEKEGIPTMAEITREVILRVTAQPLEGVKLSKPSPFNGRMVQIVRHWPDGTNALVGVAVGHKDTWVLPNEIDTYVALNDATPVVAVSEPVEKGEEIWIIVRNGDSANAHTISVTVVVTGEE